MSEVKFIKGFGQSECRIVQRDNEYIVEDRFLDKQKSFPIDNLLGAVLYAQENFAIVNFPQPMAIIESVPGNGSDSDNA